MGIRWMFSLFLHENICFGYSLEAPRHGTSVDYPQHMFLWKNKKNINTFGLQKASYQELCLKSTFSRKTTLSKLAWGADSFLLE